MRKIYVFIFALSMVAIRCAEPVETHVTPERPQPALMSREEIDNIIITSVKEQGDYNWQKASDKMIWSALMHSDSILTIGYQAEAERNVNGRMAEVNIHSAAWKNARQTIIDEVNAAATHSRHLPSGRTVSIKEHEVLPFMDVHVTGIETVQRLKSLSVVRYIEPSSYEVDLAQLQQRSDVSGKTTSDSGCSNDPDLNLPTYDYVTLTPNAKVSWSYDYMKIPQAWNYSTGKGITVGLIDTGISSHQTKLGSEFNSGESSGRSVQKYGTYVSSIWPWASPDGPDDKCGHGTAMAGIIAAPRSNSGSSTGVAYNCNLVAFRGTGDVVINGGKEKSGVADALVALANNSSVRIISMSIGDVFSNSKVSDAIRYAYGKGKMIFCAAGTSTSFTNWFGVIFPASMSETIAVTGIKDGSGFSRCDICHSGSKVDFAIVMERRSDLRHPITLCMDGSEPSTVGGSSVATATAAGIAALIWSRYPGWSREQVLERMKSSSSSYPNRHPDYGWGTPDALKAVQ